jgi:hypothetical protein
MYDVTIKSCWRCHICDFWAKHDFLLTFSSDADGIFLLSKEQFLMLLSKFFRHRYCDAIVRKLSVANSLSDQLMLRVR